MLIDPCEAIQAGDTVRSLAKGYVKNTRCVFEYQNTLRGLREYYKEQEALYNKK